MVPGEIQSALPLGTELEVISELFILSHIQWQAVWNCYKEKNHCPDPAQGFFTCLVTLPGSQPPRNSEGDFPSESQKTISQSLSSTQCTCSSCRPEGGHWLNPKLSHSAWSGSHMSASTSSPGFKYRSGGVHTSMERHTGLHAHLLFSRGSASICRNPAVYFPIFHGGKTQRTLKLITLYLFYPNMTSGWQK